MKKLLIGSAVLAAMSAPAFSAEEVNVYSYRQPFLIEPMFEAFTAETGIKVNVMFSKDGLAEKIEQEGEFSPADVVLTVDISRLAELSSKGLVQPVESEVLEENIPSQYRDSDDEWFALTLRTRNVYSSRDRVGQLGEDFDYTDLADPEWEGKICSRSGKNAYNVSLVASMIVNHGEEKAKEWLEGVKANLARTPQGNDRAQVRAVSEELCDLAIGNSYYLGKMVNNEEQKAWADSVYINFPGAEANGTHVNVSGMAMAKYAPNQENAQKLMEFLTSDKAQEMYAEVNYEYPVKEGVERSELVASWGDFVADDIALEAIADHHAAALRLIDEVQFDL
uniref:Fe(3+) ABC transporter substrate-binding protein n=1 Tax=Thaumasiovibrio occultus TaxID=1891184 RepID=UPI000B351EAA|nr:Fe(3+) ABC transporter substrate-binding protein [Thaumasiovibrio occultus]